jgi:serine/threonine protein kinase/Tol biopolymer transport system component
MEPERWKRVETIFHGALREPSERRAGFLRDACGDDESLRREVESLLGHAHHASGILESPPPLPLTGLTEHTAAVQKGQHVGQYVIADHLGAGGMGDVFRAHDTRLRRDVALKVLPATFAADRERFARFEREARLLASLNHPNIAAIHGLEHLGESGAPILVLELIPGDTLEERIARGPLPRARALAYARQIADALDAAHERGVVHRDLKPANIKITPDGVIKVLDFGLARTTNSPTSTDSDGPTLTATATREGVIMGTPGYMSPEQARGEVVDKRADVWAFGCVLFEMLAGSRAFGGDTVSDTLVAILDREPNWASLPDDLPAPLRRVLERCLRKDRKQRIRDIGDARLELDAVDDERPVSPMAASAWRQSPWALLTGVMAGAAVALAIWVAARPSPSDPSTTSGSALTGVTFDAEYASDPAVSPDGSLIAYASDGGTQGNLDLWLQRMHGTTPAVRLTQDEADDRSPAFSPDGATIAFRSERAGGGVFVMPALGGDARLVADGGRQPHFSPDGTRIAYWKGGPLGGARQPSSMFVSPANGGPEQRLAGDFANARSPVWSPDGKGLVFFGRRVDPSGGAANRPANLVSDADFDWWWLPASGGEAVATGVYPTLLRQGVTFLENTGGDALPESWDADGVLFSATTGQSMNLWRVKIATATGTIDGLPVRLTTGAGVDRSPSADRSGHIVFQVSKSNNTVFALALEGTASIERLATGWGFGVHRGSVSQNGRILAYPRHRPSTSELWIKELDTGKARHLVTTNFTSLDPAASADGSRVGYTVVDAEGSSSFVVSAQGGTARKICEGCFVHAWLPDNRRCIVEYLAEHPRIKAIDVEDLSREDLFDADALINRVIPAADGRWLAVGGQDVAWIVSLERGRVGTPQNSLAIPLPGSAAIPSRICGLSADRTLLYSLLGIDGFRCLYAQRVNPATGAPTGTPYAVHHFHDPARAWGSTPMGNAVTRRGFIFDQVETAGSIWLLEAARRH